MHCANNTVTIEPALGLELQAIKVCEFVWYKNTGAAKFVLYFVEGYGYYVGDSYCPGEGFAHVCEQLGKLVYASNKNEAIVKFNEYVQNSICTEGK